MFDNRLKRKVKGPSVKNSAPRRYIYNYIFCVTLSPGISLIDVLVSREIVMLTPHNMAHGLLTDTAADSH